MATIKGEPIRLVLTVEKTIRGRRRDPRHVMLQGVCNEDITVEDVAKALQLGQLEAEGKPKSAGSGDGET